MTHKSNKQNTFSKNFAILNDTRTNVIKILESYGGKNEHNLVGDLKGLYYIDENGIIDIYHGEKVQFSTIFRLDGFKSDKVIGTKIENSCAEILSYEKCKILYDGSITNLETTNNFWSVKDGNLLFFTNEDKDYIRANSLNKLFVPALGISELVEIIRKHNICKHYQTCNITVNLVGPDMKVDLYHNSYGEPFLGCGRENLYCDRGFGIQNNIEIVEGSITNNLYYIICKLYGIRIKEDEKYSREIWK